MAIRETKSQKFARIAERRVNQVLRELRLLGNLADRRNYEYTEEQVSSILRAIDREYRTLRTRFAADSIAGNERFQLPRGS